jgi:hypothetical protein
MIRALVCTALALALAGAASAQPAPIITVAVGPPLAAKLKAYGAREVGDLQAELRDTVARAVDHAHGGPCRPVRVALTLVDATPNHPTFQQVGDNPSLDMLRSRSLGGADVVADLQCADGGRASVHERYYETDIRMVRAAGVWTDAGIAFDHTAWRIARGEFDRR